MKARYKRFYALPLALAALSPIAACAAGRGGLNESPETAASSPTGVIGSFTFVAYDGHTLATVIPEIETQIGANLARIVADRGYRGHNAPPGHTFKVYISGQRRRVTETIKRELRRRSAVEPVIGHAKTEHRMARNYLAGTHGDAANAVLAAAGYNFRRLLEWLALLSSIILAALTAATSQDSIPKSA